MKVALIIGLIAIAMFGIGLPAMAAPGDGPTPPEIGDPDRDSNAAVVVPHGGYGVGTDYCLQCHQVHYVRQTGDAPGEYALMAEASVTATCATCHGFEGNGPAGPEIPDFGGDIGTASTRAVYTQIEPVHIIGAGFGSVGAIAGWDFYTWAGTGTAGSEGPEGSGNGRGVGTASNYNGGLYCGSCHTPHGEFGQLINARWAVTTAAQGGGGGTDPMAAVPWTDGTRIWWEDPTPSDPGIPANLDPADPWKQVYLFYGNTLPGAWNVCAGSTGGATPSPVAPCEYAQVLDAEDQLVSLYGYKLLTTSPNHQYPTRDSSGQYLQPGGGYGATPPVGLYSDAPFQGGTLNGSVGAPNFLSHRVIGEIVVAGGITAATNPIRIDDPTGSEKISTMTLPIAISF